MFQNNAFQLNAFQIVAYYPPIVPPPEPKRGSAFQLNAFQSSAFQVIAETGLISRIRPSVLYRERTIASYRTAIANDKPYITKLERKQATEPTETPLEPQISDTTAELLDGIVKSSKKTQKHLEAIKVNDALLVKIRLEKALLLEKLAFIEAMRIKQEQEMQEFEEIALLLFDFV
jgi:hypothetical protein